MLSKHERNYGLGMDALVINGKLSKHGRYYGVGMDALVTVCSRYTTLFWSAHGSTGNRMLSKHERYYGSGMDALVTVCSRNTNVWFGHGCTGN